MINTQSCKNCKHERICRYVDVFTGLTEDVEKLLKDNDHGIFKLNLGCKHYELAQQVQGILHRDGRGA